MLAQPESRIEIQEVMEEGRILLVDLSRGRAHPPSPVEYALFVTFFPQLIAGPIVHHREMFPQLAGLGSRAPRSSDALSPAGRV